MSGHLVSIYIKDGVMAHVQSTNGDRWLADVQEWAPGPARVLIPLRRINLLIKPTIDEIAQGTGGNPLHRDAIQLLREELEFVEDSIIYREGSPQFRQPIELVGEVRDGRIVR